MRHATRTLTIALAGGLLVAGCGDAAERLTEEAIEQGAGGDVDIDLDEDGGSFSVETPDGEAEFDMNDDGTGSFTVEGEDGSFSSESTDEMPDDFPTEVFVPGDLEVEGATRADNEGQLTFSVTGVVDSGLDDVKEQIEDSYSESDQTYFAEGDGSTNLQYEDIDGFDVSYMLGEADAGVRVTILASAAR